MKKIILIILMAVFFTACTKESVKTQQVVNEIPTANILSVVKVYAGVSANNKITYTLAGLSGVTKSNFIISGSTVVISIPTTEGQSVVYDMVSPIGPVYYNFLFTMKNGSQIPTPVRLFNP